MNPGRLGARVSLALSVVAFLGCADVPADPIEGTEDDATSIVIEEIFVPISSLELAAYRSAKVAVIRYKGSPETVEVKRCHQYRTAADWHEFIVCRDDRHELIMDAEYGNDFPRWARLRIPGGRERFLTCPQVSEHAFNREIYGGTTGHLCKSARLTKAGRAFFATIDEAPPPDEFPTRSGYVPTLWAKNPAEAWANDWETKLLKALPPGEYQGQGKTAAKKCKLKVTQDGNDLNVSIHALDESGTETRTQARLVLSSTMTFGAMRFDDLPQKVTSATRLANVFIASSETETTTNDYYARSLRVVRIADAPENVEAGHTAVYIGDDSCQRLEPRLPAW